MSYGGQQNRTDWYDRNPVPTGAEFVGGSIAPHGDTVRWTTTVAFGQRFLVESVLAMLHRDTAPGLAGFAFVYITLFGGAMVSTRTVFPCETTAAVGNGRFGNNAGAIVLVAGQSIRGNTGDQSAGGTYTFDCSMKGTAFDQ